MYVCRKKVTVQKAGKITNNYNEKRNRKGQKMQGFIRKSNKYHMGFYTGTLIIPAELYFYIFTGNSMYNLYPLLFVNARAEYLHILAFTK